MRPQDVFQTKNVSVELSLKDATKGGKSSRDDVLAGIVKCYLEIDRPHTASSLAKARRFSATFLTDRKTALKISL